MMLLIRIAVVLVVSAISVNVLAQDQSAERVATVKAAVDAYRQNREAEILTDFVDLLSIPNVATSLPLHEFGSRLAVPIIILPLANHDNNQHAENENIRLKNIWDAMQVYGAVLGSFGNR